MTHERPIFEVPGEEQSGEVTDPPIGVEVDLVIEDDGWRSLDGLEGLVEQAAGALARHKPVLEGLPASACIALSNDEAVRELNRTYRRMDKPTNVLSFPAPDVAFEQGQAAFIGDIILARETVVGEAATMGIPVAHHLQHLVVHGLLHLLGFDHEDDREAEEMEAIETRVMAELGIADPYAAVEHEAQP